MGYIIFEEFDIMYDEEDDFSVINYDEDDF